MSNPSEASKSTPCPSPAAETVEVSRKAWEMPVLSELLVQAALRRITCGRDGGDPLDNRS